MVEACLGLEAVAKVLEKGMRLVGVAFFIIF